MSRPQGHSVIGRIMSVKNSNDTIWNRTRDLPICSAAPTYKHKLCVCVYIYIYIYIYKHNGKSHSFIRSFVYSFIYSSIRVFFPSSVYFTTGPQPVLHIFLSSAFSFSLYHPPVSLRSSSSCLPLLSPLLVYSIFPAITCCRRQFLRKCDQSI